MIAAVLDTSVLVSAMVSPAGPSGEVIRYLRHARFTCLYSVALLQELLRVLTEPRMAARFRITHDDVEALHELVLLRGIQVRNPERVCACRDPNDDMVLEAAVAGHADVIVTADKDLLALHPFRGIAIVDPAAFVALLADEGPFPRPIAP